MERYSNAELADMHLTYGAANCSGRLAQRMYAQHYPLRQTPCRTFFARLHQRLSDSGSFRASRPERVRRPRTRINEEAVLDLVQNNPGCSTRGIARRVGLSHMTVWRILHSHHMYPFRMQRVQLLQDGDFAPRVAFARWYLEMCARDTRFSDKVLFTDEATFTREGIFNSHNTHEWSLENPHAIRTHAAQVRFSINVWAGILGNHLIGPYLLPQRLTGATYLVFLQQVLPQLLDEANVSNTMRSAMWFQHDGAPAHYSNDARRHLNATYGHKWIGRRGPVHWPSRSPDLSSMDYFLWGFIKGLVYETPVNSEEELVARIVVAAGELRGAPDIFADVKSSMHRRCQACITAQGRNFEQFL